MTITQRVLRPKQETNSSVPRKLPSTFAMPPAEIVFFFLFFPPICIARVKRRFSAHAPQESGRRYPAQTLNSPTPTSAVFSDRELSLPISANHCAIFSSSRVALPEVGGSIRGLLQFVLFCLKCKRRLGYYRRGIYIMDWGLSFA